MDTFITEVSTTRTNMAIASRTASLRSLAPSPAAPAPGPAVTGVSPPPAVAGVRREESSSLDTLSSTPLLLYRGITPHGVNQRPGGSSAKARAGSGWLAAGPGVDL